MEIEMKKYVGTKTIEAVPMKKKDAEVYLKREIKSQHSAADEDEDGYLVKYEDGYESWSPKEVFDKAYKKAETFIDRMEIEYAELKERFKKIVNFMYSDKGEALKELDRRCLDRQMKHMKDYLDILEIRIDNAKEDVRVAEDQKRKAEARAKEAAAKEAEAKARAEDEAQDSAFKSAKTGNSAKIGGESDK